MPTDPPIAKIKGQCVIEIDLIQLAVALSTGPRLIDAKPTFMELPNTDQCVVRSHQLNK